LNARPDDTDRSQIIFQAKKDLNLSVELDIVRKAKLEATYVLSVELAWTFVLTAKIGHRSQIIFQAKKDLGPYPKSMLDA
jgi:hypothetical protein